MSYYISKTIDGSFDDAINKVTDALGEEGFGILSDIDVQATLKKKLDADFKKYRILGACNPPFAYKALKAEDKIGVLLPCSVIVIEQEPGKIEVSAVDPITSMAAVKNESLGNVATEVTARLKRVIDSL